MEDARSSAGFRALSITIRNYAQLKSQVATLHRRTLHRFQWITPDAFGREPQAYRLKRRRVSDEAERSEPADAETG
jgi:hypothetical protein